MFNQKFYFYVTDEDLSEGAGGTVEEKLAAWKDCARRSERVFLMKLRDETGGVYFEKIEVKLSGWGMNVKGNLELTTESGFRIEIVDKTSKK